MAAISAGLFAAVATATLLKANNTLARNGHWRATKTEMVRPLLGAQSFLNGPQALAYGRLDLGAWHGFQEVLLRDALRPASLGLDFRLEQGAYLIVVFNRAEDGRFSGIRLSLSSAFPSQFFDADAAGGFVRRQPIDGAALVAGWHRLRLELDTTAARIWVDDQPLGAFSGRRVEPQQLGLRSGFKSALVDHAMIRDQNGAVLLADSFERPRHAVRSTAAAGLLTIVAVWLALTALAAHRPALSRRCELLVSVLAASLLIATLPLYRYLSQRPAVYPRATARLGEQEEQGRARYAAQIRAEIRARHAPAPAPGTYRILFIGASQTWGAGVADHDDTLVAVTERLLNATTVPAGVRFECINAGIASLRASHLLEIYRDEWLAFAPRLVVINLGNNDRNARDFWSALERMVTLSREQGIAVVLVQEPNSTERDVHGLRRRHRAMAAIGEQYAVPVIAMHDYLAERRDDGLLWWDKVHLTSYGYRLFAERLHHELLSIIARGAIASAEN